ncbi:UNVERIFIED_ORG: hypothetical protein J2740_002603 [Rhizobium nepotum]|nr:hypothetical protein [Rhizobium nepotum]
MTNDISPSSAISDLVVRSVETDGRKYGEYRQNLRYDFFHCCAYCTMSEAEASSVRFTIDHYEPVTARPELEHDYENLMYCCNTCNTLKGPRVVPPEAKADGTRFFRPDFDRFVEHYERVGVRLRGLSKLAEFTIDAVDLNRYALRRLREIRNDLYQCEVIVSQGIKALRGLKIDLLPKSIRISALNAIRDMDAAHESIAAAIDNILRDYAASFNLEAGESDAADKEERLDRLREVEALYPGSVWRVRKPKKA